MDPGHLLDQADRLLASPPSGRPRQADINRAISAAYYAAFHYLLRKAADRFAGWSSGWPLYARVYRSIDHGAVRRSCESVALRGALPGVAGAPDAQLRRACAITQELADARAKADYDPSYRGSLAEARQIVEDAREAITAFNASDAGHLEFLLADLAFPKSRPTGRA